MFDLFLTGFKSGWYFISSIGLIIMPVILLLLPIYLYDISHKRGWFFLYFAIIPIVAGIGNILAGKGILT